MLKQLRKDNNKIFDIQISSQSEQEIKQTISIRKENLENNFKQQKKMTAFDLNLNKNNDSNIVSHSQSKISVITGNISKLTFMDLQQSDESNPQQNETTIHQNQIDREEQKNAKKSQFPVRKQNSTQSYMLLQKGESNLEQSRTKIRKKLNLGRGVGNMQLFTITDRLTINDQIDYNQFQTSISPSKRKVQETHTKPKKFFQIESIQKNSQKVQTLPGKIGQKRQQNCQNSSISVMNNYEQYIQDSEQEQNNKNKNKTGSIKNQESNSSKKEYQQNQGAQSQPKTQYNQHDKVTGQSQQQKDNQSCANNFLFEPSEQHIQNGKQIGQNLTNSSIISEIVRFLISPIPLKTRMQFEVIRKRQLIQVSYQFWIILQGRKNRIMKSVNNSINIQSTVFHILLAMDQPTKLNLNLATMKSNFRRQQFYLTSNQIKESKVLAAIAASNKLSITQNKRMQLYTPVLSQNKQQFKHIHINKISNNLRKLKQMTSTRNQVNKISSLPISLKNWQIMRRKHEIRISKRNVLMGQNRENYVFFMGKTIKDSYYLASLDGVSPIQLFAFAIFQLFK